MDKLLKLLERKKNEKTKNERKKIVKFSGFAVCLYIIYFHFGSCIEAILRNELSNKKGERMNSMNSTLAIFGHDVN